MRVLLVGWDAADWKIIDPLLERGEMPNLAGLLSAGVRGNIATLQPALSPMLWTSIATGKRPPKHGILGFTEPTPDGRHVRPITNLGRRTKAVWNVLNQNGKRSIVVGWWPSHPAEPIRGAMVSDRFPQRTSEKSDSPLPPGAVWPQRLAESLAGLRVHATEITGEMLRMFSPDYDRVDQGEDTSVHDLAGLIAESMSIHGAATELLETEPWDFAAIYYVGLDHFSHRFMRFHAGKPPRRSETPEVFQPIVGNAYRYHDAMLGRLLQLAGPECAVMLVSDHGFHSDHLLPDYIPPEGAGPAVEHRDFGIFCMRAPGVSAGEQIYGATVLDVAPTVLHLFGLPVGQDMDGKVLVNAFRRPTPPQSIPTWDEVSGDDGCHPPERRVDSAGSEETLHQLIALGYVAPRQHESQRVEASRMESRYNLARAWIDAGRPDEAAPLLRQLVVQDPEAARFYVELFRCLLLLEDEEEAQRLLEQFDAICPAMSTAAAAELERRERESPTAQLSQLREGPDQAERHERRTLSEKATGYPDTRQLMRCELALARTQTKQPEAARELLRQLSPQLLENPQLKPFLARAYARAGMEDQALGLIAQAPESVELLSIEARIHHFAGRHADAARSAIAALALVYFQPSMHYVLGVAFERLGDRERAISELRVAVAQAPGMKQAHQALAEILVQTPGGIGQASLHLAKAEEQRRIRNVRPSMPSAFERLAPPPADREGLITIVSGLPRSGTSMMMQMLNAAGIAPYTDGLRTADEDNPRGYFEHADAARLYQDTSWIPQARGKAVKIVAQLLPHLPHGTAYRIVFLHRDLTEVVASQRAMLRRIGRAGAVLSEPELIRAYVNDLQSVEVWLREHTEVPVLAVQYADALNNPSSTAGRLAGFLGEPFGYQEAAAAVSAGLRRQRA